MSSTTVLLAIALVVFAAYMWWLGDRSARGAMGRSGPGIRIAETLACEHTWAAAQEVAAPIYRQLTLALAGTAALTLLIGVASTVASVVVGLVLAAGLQVFLLGVASVRARKAAAAVQCEHKQIEKSPRATPPHRRGANKRVTPKRPQPKRR